MLELETESRRFLYPPQAPLLERHGLALGWYCKHCDWFYKTLTLWDKAHPCGLTTSVSLSRRLECGLTHAQ